MIFVRIKVLCEFSPKLFLELWDSLEVPGNDEPGAVKSILVIKRRSKVNTSRGGGERGARDCLFLQLESDFLLFNWAPSLAESGQGDRGGGHKVIGTEAIKVVNGKLDGVGQFG